MAAKLNNGILGTITGKVGGVVGYIVKGVNIIRSYVPHIHNPRTEAQQHYRERMKVASQLVNACLPFVNSGYAHYTAHHSAINQAVSDNLRNGSIVGTGTDLIVDYTLVSLSRGSLLTPDSPTAVQGTGHTVDVSWTDNTGISPEVLASDIVMVCLYNPARQCSTSDLLTATRATATLTVNYPALWVGDQVHAFLAVRSADGSLVSNTAYMGVLTLT